MNNDFKFAELDVTVTASECFVTQVVSFFLSQAQCVLHVFDSFVLLKKPNKSLRYRGNKWRIFWQSFFAECRSGGLVVDLPFAPICHKLEEGKETQCVLHVLLDLKNSLQNQSKV